MWEAVNAAFDCMPLAALIDGHVFCVHGGIPKALCERDSSLKLIDEVPNPLSNVLTHDSCARKFTWYR